MLLSVVCDRGGCMGMFVGGGGGEYKCINLAHAVLHSCSTEYNKIVF